MKNIISIAIFALLMISANQSMAQMNNNSPIKNVSAHDAQQILKNGDYIILDIRTPQEFKASKIEGAINIDFYEKSFKNKLNELDKNQDYFVYCRSGNRTGQSMPLFQALGFKNIVHLQRGIVDWLGSNYEMIN